MAILRAVDAFGCRSPGIRHRSSNSTNTYGNPGSSRIRRRNVRSTSSSRLNWGTTMSGVAPRAVASAAVARSTSHVTAMPRSIVVSRRYGTMSVASDISRACGTARQPDQSRSEMRTIVVEIPAEERGHEERDERDGPLKARQFGFDAQVRLICRVAVHREVRALHVHQRANLRRDRLVPVQPFSEHHRLARKNNRWPCGIDGLVDATHAITGGIERERDRSSADGLVPLAARDERPAESRIGTPQRLDGREQPLRRRMQPAQSEFACANRENGGDRGSEHGRRAFGHESTDARARNEQQKHAKQRERDSRRRFEEHVPAPHQIERRQQVMVEPALREDDREHDESDAGTVRRALP